MWLRAKQPHKFWHATVGKVAGIHTVETTIGVLVSPTCRIPVLGERLKCTVRSIWSSRATSFNQHASLFLARNCRLPRRSDFVRYRRVNETFGGGDARGPFVTQGDIRCALPCELHASPEGGQNLLPPEFFDLLNPRRVNHRCYRSASTRRAGCWTPPIWTSPPSARAAARS